MIEEDKSLFLSEMNDVSPLKTQNKTAQYQQERIKEQAKVTVKNVKKKRRVPALYDTEEACVYGANTSAVHAHETIFFHQKGIPLQTLTKLRKGAFTNQAELDLHGYTRDEAQLAINHFIATAYQNKLRHIRIIHGKGYNSEELLPALKNLVNQSLRTFKTILAFYSAPEKEGGTGAVNILVKKHNDTAK